MIVTQRSLDFHPSLLHVESSVFLYSHKKKIGWPVIITLAVYVVGLFALAKWSANNLLQHISGSRHLSSIQSLDSNVSIGVHPLPKSTWPSRASKSSYVLPSSNGNICNEEPSLNWSYASFECSGELGRTFSSHVTADYLICLSLKDTSCMVRASQHPTALKKFSHSLPRIAQLSRNNTRWKGLRVKPNNLVLVQHSCKADTFRHRATLTSNLDGSQAV